MPIKCLKRQINATHEPKRKSIETLHNDELRREKKYKRIRIDPKIEIFIPVEADEDEARNEYLLKLYNKKL